MPHPTNLVNHDSLSSQIQIPLIHHHTPQPPPHSHPTMLPLPPILIITPYTPHTPYIAPYSITPPSPLYTLTAPTLHTSSIYTLHTFSYPSHTPVAQYLPWWVAREFPRCALEKGAWGLGVHMGLELPQFSSNFFKFLHFFKKYTFENLQISSNFFKSLHKKIFKFLQISSNLSTKKFQISSNFFKSLHK